MSRLHIERRIRAPVSEVFRVIGDMDRFQDAIPSIVSVEFLSDTRRGVGTRFRETRRVGSRTSALEMEVTEFVENERVQLVSHSMGTEWNSTFLVAEDGSYTRLELDLQARPKNLLGRILTPMMRGMMRAELEKDMDAVKAYCEDRETEPAERKTAEA